MTIDIFFNGLLIGILASMPVGALAVLSVQRTMSIGLISGFVIGLGAAVADIIHGSVAAFGVSIISDFLIKYDIIFGLIGSFFLLIIGYRIFVTDAIKEFKKNNKFSKRKLLNDFFSSLVIAISNPVNIIGFGGFFASFGVANQATSTLQIILLLFGVFMGAILWWFSLSFIVNIFRSKIKMRNIFWINKIMGAFVFLLGIALIILIIFYKDKI